MTSKNIDRVIELVKENNQRNNVEIISSLLSLKIYLEKLEKVIEVLKKFNFNLNETRHNNSGFEIWTDSLSEYVELTKEEYDLLKEVFGNGI